MTTPAPIYSSRIPVKVEIDSHLTFDLALELWRYQATERFPGAPQHQLQHQQTTPVDLLIFGYLKIIQYLDLALHRNPKTSPRGRAARWGEPLRFWQIFPRNSPLYFPERRGMVCLGRQKLWLP
jgi:hypothetical protein